jgi:hypothetical protein
MGRMKSDTTATHQQQNRHRSQWIGGDFSRTAFKSNAGRAPHDGYGCS